MANTSGEKELRTDWPFVQGLVAGTTRQAGTSGVLEVEEEDLTTQDSKVGL